MYTTAPPMYLLQNSSDPPSMNIVEASYTRGTLVIGRQVVWLPDMWSEIGLPQRNPAVCSWEYARST